MPNNSFTIPVIGEIRRKAGEPTTAGVNVVTFGSENRQVSTLNGAFKIQPYTGVQSANSEILFDEPIVDADGNVVLGWISSATVAALLALWNA